MLVTLSGILIVAREEQPLNAELPILVTESGILMDVREEHNLNVES